MPTTIIRIERVKNLVSYWREIFNEYLAVKQLSRAKHALSQMKHYEKLLEQLNKQLCKEQKQLAKLAKNNA